jgi:ABC-2 type transport system permease protein
VIHLLQAEWIKFRSVRSTWVLTGIAVVLSLLIAGIAANTDNGGQPAVETLSVSSTFVFILLLVLGIQFIGQEYRFGTIRSTFTAVPNRTRVILAKTTFGAAIGAVTGLVAFVGSFAVASIVFAGEDRSISFDARLAETITAYVVVAAVSVVFGIGIGAITRNPALGIAAALIDMFVLESLVFVFVSEDLGSVLPFSASFAAMPGAGTDTFLSPWFVALAVYATWAVGLLVIGGLIVERRDP